MVCGEHESAPQMYCKKCDTHVCDMCHKIDHPGHYHYLFLDKPVSPDASMEEEKAALSSAEKIKAIKEKAEQVIRQQIQERPLQQKQETLRQKAIAAINKKKELDDAEKKT